MIMQICESDYDVKYMKYSMIETRTIVEKCLKIFGRARHYQIHISNENGVLRGRLELAHQKSQSFHQIYKEVCPKNSWSILPDGLCASVSDPDYAGEYAHS